MNKFMLILMSILWAAAAFVSCSGADPSKLSGATTEPNGTANEESETTNTLSSDNTKLSSVAVAASSSSAMVKSSNSATEGASSSAKAGSSSSAKAVSSSSVNAVYSSSRHAGVSSSSGSNTITDTLLVPIPEEMQKRCDSVLAAFENTADQGVSRTGFDFKSESELFYATQSCSVNIYEQESGVRILYGDGGHLENTSLYYQDRGVLLRLLNNTYGGGACEQDLFEFKKNCRKESGVFKDYNNGEGCSLGKLELACASVVDASAPRAMLQREANLYKKVCQGIIVPGDQECSATCEFVGNEMACDTVCHSL